MRWAKPKSGDVKIKKKFAILPITAGDEIRWLEFVTVKYKYCYDKYNVLGWHKICFVDEE
jgi:hypothetical protein